MECDSHKTENIPSRKDVAQSWFCIRYSTIVNPDVTVHLCRLSSWHFLIDAETCWAIIFCRNWVVQLMKSASDWH